MPSGTWSFSSKGYRTSTVFNVSTGNVISQSQILVSSSDALYSRTSGTSPGWPKTRRTNAFTFSKSFTSWPTGYTRVYSDGKLFIEETGFVYGNSGVYLLDAVLAAEVQKSSSIDRATNDLLDRIKDQKFNLAVAVAERKQTMKMILSTATSVTAGSELIADANQAQKSGTAAEKRRASRKLSKFLTGSPSLKGKAKHISNLVLQVKYGWQPLLSDIRGAAEHIAEQERVKPAITRVQARNSVDLSTEIHVPGAYRGSQTGKLDTTAYVRFISSQSSPLSALGLTNPAALLWEATTLSFVADWFLDIGGYLNRFDSGVGVTFLDGGLTQFQRVTMTTVSSTATTGYAVNCKGFKTEVRVNRSVYTTIPTPPVPKFKSPLSLGHCVSALALIVQRIK